MKETATPGRAELESAASRALECVKAKGFESVEVGVSESSDGSLGVFWGYDATEDEDKIEAAIRECEAKPISVQRAYEAQFQEADRERYRQLAEELEEAGMDLGDWNGDNLSSALAAAHEQEAGIYMRCFREVFPNSGA